MRYRFADCLLDLERRELLRDGALVEIQPKVFDLLRFLLENRERLVTRQELLESVWDGTIVGDAAIARAIREVRRAVGDDGEAQRILKTAHARGFRFVAEVTPADAAVAVAPPSARAADDDFIGREAALRSLEGLLDDRGRSLLVTGEPGIGKTFLVERFLRIAAERGFATHVGRCSEADGVPALWPWEQIVRSVVAQADASSPVVTAATLDLAPLLGDAKADGQHARFRMQDGCARLLAEAARARPIAVVLEDIHLADPESLSLLQYVVARLRSAPVAIVATMRERGSVAAMSGTLSLGGFEPDEVRRFVTRQLGEAPHPKVAETLQQWTGGNPLFLSHLVHLTAGDDSRSARVPRILRDVVEQTLEVLSEDARTTLATAAVVGIEFRLVVLAKAMGRASSELLDAIGEAAEHRLVRRVAGRVDTFAFVHGVLRDVLYAQLGLGDRARRHAAIGDAIASVHASMKEEHAEELAHHFLRAASSERADEAVTYAALAGDRAVARAAYAQAATLYRAALDALPLAEGRSPARARLLVRLGSALGRDGHLAEAGAAFRDAALAGDERKHDSAPFVKDVALLRESFERILRRAPEVTTRFYDRLFAAHPELRSLFRRNSAPLQAKMMTDTLLAVIDRLEDAPWLRASLAALGARHVEYGVEDAMYPRVGGVLLATLAEAAGPDVWTPAVAEAWAQAFRAITEMMLEGSRAMLPRAG